MTPFLNRKLPRLCDCTAVLVLAPTIRYARYPPRQKPKPAIIARRRRNPDDYRKNCSRIRSAKNGAQSGTFVFTCFSCRRHCGVFPDALGTKVCWSESTQGRFGGCVHGFRQGDWHGMPIFFSFFYCFSESLPLFPSSVRVARLCSTATSWQRVA